MRENRTLRQELLFLSKVKAAEDAWAPERTDHARWPSLFIAQHPNVLSMFTMLMTKHSEADASVWDDEPWKV